MLCRYMHYTNEQITATSRDVKREVGLRITGSVNTIYDNKEPSTVCMSYQLQACIMCGTKREAEDILETSASLPIWRRGVADAVVNEGALMDPLSSYWRKLATRRLFI